MEDSGEHSKNLDKAIDEVFAGNDEVEAFKLLTDLDDARKELYEELEKLTKGAYSGEVAMSERFVSVDSLNECIHARINQLFGEYGVDAAQQYIVEDMKRDADTRVDLLRELLGDEKTVLHSFSREHIAQRITHYITASATLQEAAVQIANFYTTDVANDIGTFSDLLVEKLATHNSHVTAEGSVPQFELSKEPKDHVVDVLKIAAGVSIALAIDRILRRGK